MAITVLIADELQEVTDILHYYLSKHGKYTPIQTINCPQDVADIVAIQQPDLILMDTLWHGELKGLDIYELIKANNHDGIYYPVVIGMSASLDFKQLWNNKGIPFLLKPITEQALHETLESVL